MFEFPCPHCSAPLRVRDQSLRNRSIECPDCNQPVLIQAVAGRLMGTTSTGEQSSADRSVSAELPQAQPLNGGLSLLMIVAVVCAIVLLGGIILWSQQSRSSPPQVQESPAAESTDDRSTQRTATAASTEKNSKNAAVDSTVAVNSDSLADDVADSDDSVATQLRGIHELIAQYLDKHQMFPAGTVESPLRVDDRLSWIAVVDHQFQNGSLAVDWEQPWNAAVNDRFTRRWIKVFENPALNRAVGNDQRPATHFVGVTGYGVGSEKLPINHPRAGIFGVDRQTQLTDVLDGLSNTMLLAGVSDHLGSWAKSGNATMRGFVKTPYINGPDGFGTGTADGMHVLLADGSVRFLNAEIPPVIVERLSAMADGLSLKPESIPHQVMVPPGDQPQQQPILVPMVSDEPQESMAATPFNLNEHLEHRISGYYQPKATKLSVILFELEELLGVSIERSALAPEQLQQEITLNADEVSLRELLEQVAQAAQLELKIVENTLELQPREVQNPQ